MVNTGSVVFGVPRVSTFTGSLLYKNVDDEEGNYIV